MHIIFILYSLVATRSSILRVLLLLRYYYYYYYPFYEIVVLHRSDGKIGILLSNIS